MGSNRFDTDRFLRVLLAMVFTVSLASANGADNSWRLVWSDEFDGTRLDYTKWAVEENAHGGGNGEEQFFVDRPENVRVENGNLVLEARK